MPAVPERTYQATILQLDEPESIAVQRPSDAIPGRGGVNVQMQAKLAGDLPGVREYLSWYPYSCFEQRTSIAIGLRDPARWASLMRALPDYLDRDGMVKYWTILRDGDDSLTAYVLSFRAKRAGRFRKICAASWSSALIGFVEGRVVRYSALPTADLAIRKVAALEALSRRRNPSTRLARQHRDRAQPVAESAVIDWYLVLKRSPNLAKRDSG